MTDRLPLNVNSWNFNRIEELLENTDNRLELISIEDCLKYTQIKVKSEIHRFKSALLDMTDLKATFIILDGSNYRNWAKNVHLYLSSHKLQHLLVKETDVVPRDTTLKDAYYQFSAKVLQIMHTNITKEIRNCLPEPGISVSEYWESIKAYFFSMTSMQIEQLTRKWNELEYT